MRSNRFVDLRNARKSVTESVTKIDRNDLISVSLDTERMVFTVHDKFFRSEYGFEINYNMPESWVRLRIGLSNKVINQAVKNNRLCGVMAVLTYFVENSKTPY